MENLKDRVLDNRSFVARGNKEKPGAAEELAVVKRKLEVSERKRRNMLEEWNKQRDVEKNDLKAKVQQLTNEMREYRHKNDRLEKKVKDIEAKKGEVDGKMAQLSKELQEAYDTIKTLEGDAKPKTVKKKVTKKA